MSGEKLGDAAILALTVLEFAIVGILCLALGAIFAAIVAVLTHAMFFGG